MFSSASLAALSLTRVLRLSAAGTLTVLLLAGFLI